MMTMKAPTFPYLRTIPLLIVVYLASAAMLQANAMENPPPPPMPAVATPPV